MYDNMVDPLHPPFFLQLNLVIISLCIYLAAIYLNNHEDLEHSFFTSYILYLRIKKPGLFMDLVSHTSFIRFSLFLIFSNLCIGI